MSYSNPAAPPPSYNELFNDQSENTDLTGYRALTANSANHNQVPLDLNTLHLPAQTSLEPQQQTQSAPEVIVIQGGPLILGPYPTRIQCPNCHKSTLTRIEYRNSCTTHIIATLLCLMGCFCLAPIPYCVDNCKNAAHYCRKCSNYIATDFNGAILGYH